MVSVVMVSVFGMVDENRPFNISRKEKTKIEKELGIFLDRYSCTTMVSESRWKIA